MAGQVSVSDQGVAYNQPDGDSQFVAWDDLHTILIETTAAQSGLPDAFFILEGDQGSCLAPMNASGADTLLIEIQQLPGFNHERVIAAMASTHNQRLVCGSD